MPEVRDDVHVSVTYTPACVWSAEGARVGIVTCERCGAAVLVDSRDKVSATSIHTAWHAANDREVPDDR